MPYLLSVNPIGKKKTKKTKTKKILPKKPAKKIITARSDKMSEKKKKKAKKTTVSTTTIVRKNPVKPPSPKKKSSDGTLEIGKMLRGAGAASLGMVAAKIAVNKLTDGGSETVRWTWPNIFMAAGASLLVSFALGALLRLKRPTTVLIALGGFALAIYKIITCKIAPKWAWSESWFGADDPFVNPELMGEQDVIDYQPAIGQLPGYMGLGQTNYGGKMVPFVPEFGSTDYGGQKIPFNPQMGAVQDQLATANRIMAAYSNKTAAYSM